MVHGDDNGLVLPPRVAPTQVVIVPIMQKNPDVMKKANEYKAALLKSGVRVKLDDSDRSPGWKFAEHEMKGIPLRVEIGPRDVASGVAVLAKRNDGQKISVNDADVAKESSNYIQAQILQQASATLLATANQAPSIALNLI